MSGMRRRPIIDGKEMTELEYIQNLLKAYDEIYAEGAAKDSKEHEELSSKQREKHNKRRTFAELLEARDRAIKDLDDKEKARRNN